MSRDAYQRYSAEGSWYCEVALPGFKCNMTDIQATLGLQHFKKLPKFQKRRKEIVRRYNQVLAEYEEFQIPVQRAGIDSAWHLYRLRLNLDRLTIGRARFIEELRVRNIGTSVHFMPIHIQPYYRDKYRYEPGDYPVAYGNYLRLLTLPLNLRITDSDVEDVLEAVSDVIKKNRR